MCGYLFTANGYLSQFLYSGQQVGDIDAYTIPVNYLIKTFIWPRTRTPDLQPVRWVRAARKFLFRLCLSLVWPRVSMQIVFFGKLFIKLLQWKLQLLCIYLVSARLRAALSGFFPWRVTGFGN